MNKRTHPRAKPQKALRGSRVAHVLGCCSAALIFSSLNFAPALEIELDGEIFDPGVFAEGEVQIIGGQIVVKEKAPPVAPDAVTPDPAGNQVVELTDGSQLHGTLVTLGRNEVIWKRADATEPLTFTPQEVRRFILTKSLAAKEPVPDATLKLSGSDWITGQLLEFRDDKFIVNIGGEQPLTISREKVEWLALSPENPPDTYDGPVGPMGMAGWETAVEAGATWDYADGALVAKTPSAILRQFEVFPHQVDIQFTAGDGGSANRGLTLWLQPGSRTRGYGKGSCYLRFQSSTVTANYHTGEQMKNFSGAIPEEKEEKKLTRYRLLFDRKAGRLVVFVNGAQVADWDLPETDSVTANGSLSWQPSYWSSNMSWTLSNVRVLPWDGLLPSEAQQDAGKDVLSISGQPRKSGALGGISGTSVIFGGAETSRQSPMFLRLAPPDQLEPPPSAIARVWLARRGEFDVTGIGFRDGTLRVRTSFGGDLTLPYSAVRAIEFPHRLGSADKTSADSGDLLIFKNGDQLRGKMLAASHDQPIRWKPVKGDKSVEFATDRVSGILLPTRNTASPNLAEAGTPEDKLRVAVRLQNGDWLPGELLGLNDELVRLRPEWGAEIALQRSAVRTMYLSAAGEAPVWDGASEREAWLKGTNAPGYWGEAGNRGRKEEKKPNPWRYLDGAYTLTSSSGNRGYNSGPNLGRTLQAMPDKVDLSFVLSTTKGPASYSFQLFFDDNKPGFMVQGGWDSAYLYDMSPRRNGAAFFNQPQQLEFGAKVEKLSNERHFRFLAERKTGRIWMFVNGEFVGALNKRVGGDSPKGKGISIVPQPMLSRVTVSNIWLAPWSGILPVNAARAKSAQDDEKAKADKAEGEATATKEERPKAPAPIDDPASEPSAESVSHDTIALSNGDETIGTVTKATSEKLTLKCEVGDLEIPLERTTLIDFSTKAVAPSKGIRLRFAGKGALTVDSLRLENGKAICHSAATGPLTFPADQITEIIYEPNSLPRLPATEKETPPTGNNPPARAVLDLH
jgi:hypothetical protein